jgi:hypothetical protein
MNLWRDPIIQIPGIPGWIRYYSFRMPVPIPRQMLRHLLPSKTLRPWLCFTQECCHLWGEQICVPYHWEIVASAGKDVMEDILQCEPLGALGESVVQFVALWTAWNVPKAIWWSGTLT